MNHTELWEKAKTFLQEDMNPLSYENWIEKPLRPVYFEENVLGLEVIDTLHSNTVRDRYFSMVENAVSRAAGQKISVRLMSIEERVKWQEEQSNKLNSVNRENPFNPKYTFSSFVVAPSNQFAHAAAKAVAEQPGRAFNPLFLYSPAGLGKTHLMHAIGHYIQETYPNLKLMYLPSESFMNQLIEAIQKNTTQAFRERFRNLDVLMLDDVQFIVGRDTTQEELFHTFNVLHAAGKAIVLSADRKPSDFKNLEERLRTRFEWGLIADIQKPDLDTKIAILRNKAEQEHIEINNKLLEFIATRRTMDSIRELEGALTTVIARARLMMRPIDEQVISEALNDTSEIRDRRSITPKLIIEEVSKYLRVDEEQVTGNSRRKEFAQARHLSIYLIRTMTGLSLMDIGVVFGGRDHSTILSSYNKIRAQVESDVTTREVEETKAAVADLKQKILQM